MSEYSVDAAFDAWVATLPAKHWAKYDISACRLGWEAQHAERIKADEGAVRDPHHNGDCEWRWDGERLYQRVTGQSKWVECKRIHVTKARIKAIHSILFPRPPAQAAHLSRFEALGAEEPIAEPVAESSVEFAYAMGWRRAALWANRDDLICDIDSPAFERDRTTDLGTQPAQSVDVEAIGCMADLLRAVSPEGERWTSSNPNNPTVLDIRYLAEKLTAALQEKGNAN